MIVRKFFDTELVYCLFLVNSKLLLHQKNSPHQTTWIISQRRMEL